MGALKGDLKGYERGVAQLQEGIDCRALWLSVIQQAICDSLGHHKEHKKDLAQVVKSEWWSYIFALAGVEHEAVKVADLILANLASQPKPLGSKKRHYTHGYAHQ